MIEPILTDTSHAFDDIHITQGQKDALQKLEQRRRLIEPVVEGLFPARSQGYFDEMIARRYRKNATDFSEDDKWEARDKSRNYRYNKTQLVDQVAQSRIPDGDISEYISVLHSLGRELSHKNTELMVEEMLFLAEIPDSLDEARVYVSLARRWKDEFLQNVDEDEVKWRVGRLHEIIRELSGSHIFPRPDKRSTEEIEQLFEAFTEAYSYLYSLPADYDRETAEKFIFGAQRAGLGFHDAEQTRKVLRLFKNVSPFEDRATMRKFAEEVTRYTANHGLSDDAVDGFGTKLLPALHAADSDVEILLRGGNIWGMGKGDFGVADFICHAYAQRITPANLSALTMILREVPTTNLARLEQNRLDGLTLRTPFGILRDFIHDQRPYVHDVVAAMVNYYDTGNKQALLSVLQKTDYLSGSNERLIDRSLYETEVDEVVHGWHTNDHGGKIKPITVLRRLVENTSPFEEELPKTRDTELNQRLGQLMQNKQNGIVSREMLGQALRYVNDKLVAMMGKGEIGIEPSYVLALSWLERRGFEVLQHFTFEDQMGAYKEGWFQELLRFQDLTAAPGAFNKEAFDAFLVELGSKKLEEKPYSLIARRMLIHVGELGQQYHKAGRNDRAGALASGNVTNELIKLRDMKPARTKECTAVRAGLVDPRFDPYK